MATNSTKLDERPAMHAHVTMSRADFRTYIAKVYGWRGVRGTVFRAPYQHVEYFNAPAGLIVLAHHANVAGHVDGIHPVSLSHHVEGWASIVEPFGRSGTHAMHFLPRKWQGKLIHAAFGRMVHSGEAEVPSFDRDDGYSTLEVFDGPDGPIVAVIESAAVAHIIRPVAAAAEQREAA